MTINAKCKHSFDLSLFDMFVNSITPQLNQKQINFIFYKPKPNPNQTQTKPKPKPKPNIKQKIDLMKT